MDSVKYIYLNTSNVKVQQESLNYFGLNQTNLNTSNVKVQPPRGAQRRLRNTI